MAVELTSQWLLEVESNLAAKIGYGPGKRAYRAKRWSVPRATHRSILAAALHMDCAGSGVLALCRLQPLLPHGLSSLAHHQY